MLLRFNNDKPLMLLKCATYGSTWAIPEPLKDLRDFDWAIILPTFGAHAGNQSYNITVECLGSFFCKP